MEEDKNILDELNKGACMGMDALTFIIKKVDDDELKTVLENGYQDYKKFTEKIKKMYPEYSSKTPHETSTMNKAMTWYGIEMKTMLDQSNSKISELLLQGVNMGVIEGKKLLNNKKTNKEIESLIQEYVKFQELFAEKIKNYL